MRQEAGTQIGGARGATLLALLAMAAALVLCASHTFGAATTTAHLDSGFGQQGHVFVAGQTGAYVDEGRSGQLFVATGGQDSFVVTKYRPNGSVDARFGDHGATEIRFPSLVRPPQPEEGVDGSGGASATAVKVGPDGKILVAGSYFLGSGPNHGEVAILARLNRGGAIDSSFGGSRIQGEVPGLVIFDSRDRIDAISLQGGKILIAGTTGRGFVGRLNADGSLDTNFGGRRYSGWVSLPPPPENKTRYSVSAGVSGLRNGPGGTVYVAGYANGDLMLARLRKNGTLDPRFAGHGLVRTNGSATQDCLCSKGTGLARDRHGRLLLAGSLESNNGVSLHRQIVVARYRPNGALDRSFGHGGIVRTSANTATYGNDITLQRDGRIVVAGSSARAHRGSNDGPESLTVVRYLPDGRRDTSFYGDGIFKSRFGGIGAEGLDALVDHDGRVVVAGSITHGVRFQKISVRGLLARFLPGH